MHFFHYICNQDPSIPANAASMATGGQVREDIHQPMGLCQGSCVSPSQSLSLAQHAAALPANHAASGHSSSDLRNLVTDPQQMDGRSAAGR
jgi:hypothetical protein